MIITIMLFLILLLHIYKTSIIVNILTARLMSNILAILFVLLLGYINALHLT